MKKKKKRKEIGSLAQDVTGPAVLSQGQACPQLDRWQCLQTFLVVTIGGQVLLESSGRSPGVSSTSYSAEHGPSPQSHPAPEVNSAEVGNLL